MEKRKPGRPRKDQEPTLEELQAKAAEQDAMLEEMKKDMMKSAQPQRSGPYEGRFPSIDDEIETRRYRFVNNQSSGTPVEFSKGRTVIGKNGRLTTVWERFNWEDGKEYDVPVDVAKHVNNKTYSEKGQIRNRASLVEV